MSDGLPPIQSFDDLERIAAEAMVPPFKSRFGALFLGDLDAPGPEHEYLIDDFLTVGDKSVIGGPSQSGKSFLAIHAGLCVATGTPFFGRPVKPGLVVYQAGEGARGVKKRLRAWRRHFGVSLTNETPFVLLQSQVDLWRPDGDTRPLIDEVRRLEAIYGMKVALVVIDTLATATGGADENSGKDMGAVMANVGLINSMTGAHVCLVHHMNAKGEKLRGHTSVYANLDQAIFVTRNEANKVRTVKLDKQKDDESDVSFQFELLAIELGQRDDGRPITSCVVVDVGRKAEFMEKRAAEAGFKLRDSEVLLFRSLLTSLANHGIQAPSELSLPLGTRVVEYRHWRDEFARIAPFDQEDESEAAKKKRADAIRKRIETAGQSLQKFGVIGRANPYVWWTGKAVRGFPETFERDAAAAPASTKIADPEPSPDDDVSDLL